MSGNDTAVREGDRGSARDWYADYSV